MVQRTTQTTVGGPTKSEMDGSVLDAKKMPVPKPGTVSAEVRQKVKEIFKPNPHLWSPGQLDPVIRLAEMKLRYEAMTAQIDREGLTTEDRFGVQKPHPLLSAHGGLCAAILSLERALGITFVARDVQVKQVEEQQPAKASRKRAATKNGSRRKAPVLQLA